MSYYRVKRIAEVKRYLDQRDREMPSRSSTSAGSARSIGWRSTAPATRPKPVSIGDRDGRSIFNRAKKRINLQKARSSMSKSPKSSKANSRKSKAATSPTVTARRSKRSKSKYSKGWATRRARAKALGASPHAFKPDHFGRAVGKDIAAAQAAVPSSLNQNMQRMRDDLAKALFGDNAPGHGEIVGGADAKLADELMKLARSKGGADKVQAKLRVIQEVARYEGEHAQDAAHTKRLVDVQQKMADAIVCGFIAEVDMAQQTYRGLPPDMVWTLNSLTVLKIVDALNAAGYGARGRNGSGQLIGKSHNS